jgi:hypothetical protein
MYESVALETWRDRARRADRGHRRPPAKAAAGVAALGALCCVVIGGRVLNGEGAPAPPRRAASPFTPGPPPCPAVDADLHVDVDGDGCDEPVSFANGVLTVGATRMRLGAPGDEVAVGRWSCAAATLALLRPSTGELFRFDGWATAGRSVAAIAIGRVEGAVGVHASDRDGGRCDDLVVTRSSGPPVLLPERPVAG